MDNKKTKPIGKEHSKKPYRSKFQNNNPHNKLSLNKYHQIEQPHFSRQKSQTSKLHKRKRDLQRMIRHCEQKGIVIDEVRKQELLNIQNQLKSRRKDYQKDKRKQYFLEQKYKDIKRIQLRKVYKKIDQLKNDSTKQKESKSQQIQEWQQKLRYIKNFPKNLKYISLFPSMKPLEEKTLEFQKKIMNDIEESHKKRVDKLNFYKSENQENKKKNIQNETDKLNKGKSILPTAISKNGKKTKKVLDDFFIAEEESQVANQEQDISDDQNQNDDDDDSGVEIEDDEQSD